MEIVRITASIQKTSSPALIMVDYLEDSLMPLSNPSVGVSQKETTKYNFK
jgi:hypothetical protein